MKTKFLLVLALSFLAISTRAQNAVIIPGTISGTEFNLNLQNGTFQFYEGINTTTMGVNGDILGPTLIMQKGDFMDITVNNNINDTTTIHWHGMHVSAANDGGPHTTIAPGESWNPKFTVLDNAGTYWYHPHLHEKTNKHVSLGIAGFIIVQDEDEAALDLPRTYGIDDFPLVIQTKDFDAQKEIIVPSNSDDVLLVNATIDPSLDVPAQVIRFRLLNGSSMRVFNIGLSGNETFYMIGSDGGLLSEPIPLTRLQMAPGERAEILIDFSENEGETITMMSFAAEFNNGIYGATYPGMGQMMTLDGYNPNTMNGNNFDIIDFIVGATNGNPVTSIPATLVELTPIPESESNITRNLNFTPEVSGSNQLNGNFYINGTTFDMDVINYSIPLNNTEIWSITNQSGIAHPFHIHDVQFYVLDRNGNPPPAAEQGRKDVILIKPQETVRFITKFEDFANDPVPYMFHCHMLIHEDGGMMLQFEVVDETIGIEEDEFFEEIIVYPNPANDRINIIDNGNSGELTKVEIFNIHGQNILSQETTDKSATSIDISSLKNGIYFIMLHTSTKKSARKLIIN